MVATHDAARATIIQSYSYDSTHTIPSEGFVTQDGSFTKLTDAQSGRNDWSLGDWAGFRDFTGEVREGDNGLFQPAIDFVLNDSYALDSVTISYNVDISAGVHAPDRVEVLFQLDGNPVTGTVVNTAFDNSDPDPNTSSTVGNARSLVVPLGGVVADRVRLEFLNDLEWTLLGEIDFSGTVVAVPEPSAVVSLLGSVAALFLFKRHRWLSRL